MNVSEALNLLMSRLGNRREAALRANCLLEMNVALTELENSPFLPWFLESEVRIPTVVDQNYVDLPADFLQEYEQGLPYIDDSDAEEPLIKGLYEDFQAKYRFSTDTDLPQHYAIFADKLFLGPTPDAIYELVLPYLVRTTAYADDTTAQTTWLHHAPNLVISKVGMVVADFHLQNANLANRFKLQFNDAYNQLFKASEMRKHTNNDYSISRTS